MRHVRVTSLCSLYIWHALIAYRSNTFTVTWSQPTFEFVMVIWLPGVTSWVRLCRTTQKKCVFSPCQIHIVVTDMCGFISKSSKMSMRNPVFHGLLNKYSACLYLSECIFTVKSNTVMELNHFCIFLKNVETFFNISLNIFNICVQFWTPLCIPVQRG